jgi:hypothetical protein
MIKTTPIDCLEFKRIALAEPNSAQHSFVEHAKICPDCLIYVNSIRKMDADLAHSLNVPVPADLIANIQLNQGLQEDASRDQGGLWLSRGAIAASITAALIISFMFFPSRFSPSNEIDQDYQHLLSAVMQHVNEVAATEVWGAERANRSLNAVLASYDGDLQFKYMDNLQFGRICPMGQYQGLHATMDTPDGQVTFAYLKGKSVPALQNLSTQGYMARVKPIKGGNIIIVSRNSRGLELADAQLSSAAYWTI